MSFRTWNDQTSSHPFMVVGLSDYCRCDTRLSCSSVDSKIPRVSPRDGDASFVDAVTKTVEHCMGLRLSRVETPSRGWRCRRCGLLRTRLMTHGSDEMSLQAGKVIDVTTG